MSNKPVFELYGSPDKDMNQGKLKRSDGTVISFTREEIYAIMKCADNVYAARLELAHQYIGVLEERVKELNQHVYQKVMEKSELGG